MPDFLAVFVNCELTSEAERIAEAVVSERLAACVNILPGARSCYVWEGKLTWADEVVCVMKTTAERFDALRDRVHELHSYSVPEVIAVPIARGSEAYLRWVREGVA